MGLPKDPIKLQKFKDDMSKRMKGNNFGFKKGQKAWNKGTKGVMKPNESTFKKGQIPWNKDLKGIHLSPDSEWVKGNIPINKVEVGTITIRNNKNDGQRRLIKIADPGEWEINARYVYKKYIGEIPKDYIVHHIDRDTLNDDPSNLKCMTREDHIEEHRYDEPLKV